MHAEAKPQGASSEQTIDITRVRCVVPYLRSVGQLELIGQEPAYLILWSDRNAQIHAAIQYVDVLSELAALENMVGLEPHRIIFVLGPEDASGEGKTRDEDKLHSGA